MTQRVWLITGGSTGLGRAIAEAVTANGDKVIVTARSKSAVEDLETAAPDRVFALALNIGDEAAVSDAVRAAAARFGRVDVLVNNAGTGLIGALEEISTAEARALYDINLFGTLAVTRAVLPILRRQRAGHILFVTSAGAIANYPATSIYGSSKAALEAAAESLRVEVAPFGIRVSCLVPGLFRTEFRTRNMAEARTVIDDYSPMLGPIRARRSDPYPPIAGDPAIVGRAVVRLVLQDNPPFRLPLGADAAQVFNAKICQLQEDLRHAIPGAAN